MSNPYSITFGMEPEEVIPRPVQKNEILTNFQTETPSVRAYMITGVRGSGKTVLLTDIGNELSKDRQWIVVELNPERDLLTELAASLSNQNSLAEIFRSAKINLSFFGMGLEVKGAAPITDIEIALQRMLASLDKKGKRVLVEIDEVTNTQSVREFAAAFQIFIRKKLPVFLIMTGLYENIYDLKNEKSLTFLYRAPRIELGPLNTGAIVDNYRRVFDIDEEKAKKMAALTKGYSFGFQALGYLTWNNRGDYQGIIGQYQQYLTDYIYEKIWSELSSTDRRVTYGIAESDDGKILGIRTALNMTTNQFNPYRMRLIRKGVVDGSEHGILKFTLPLFREFVMNQVAFEEI